VQVRSRIHFALVRHWGISDVFTSVYPSMRMARISGDTQLVIEGFPRSGNSYALAAFRYANEDVVVSSHRHSPTSVRSAIRRGIPIIVLLRRPRPAIASGLQYQPGQTTEWAIELYRRYYEGILPLADRVLLATFEEVTSDFGQVIRRCNARFNTDFTPYERSEASEAIVAEVIDQAALAEFGSHELARVQARPSAPRLSAEAFLSGLGEKIEAEFEELERLYDAVALHRWTVGRTEGAPPMTRPLRIDGSR
jgi:hypothetical protein